MDLPGVIDSCNRLKSRRAAQEVSLIPDTQSQLRRNTTEAMA